MNLINATKMQAGYTLGLDKDARESLVVVVKGTFLIPRHESEEAMLAPEQVPLVTADVFTGEPGLSAPLYETDYAPRKLRCDVLLNGSAYAPGGKPVERVTVTLRVGSLVKSFDVVGKRTWQGGLLGLSASATEKFTVMPISYDMAFGGVDKTVADEAKQKCYLPNHVGVGYHDNLNAQAIVGQPLPNTEETGKPVNNPKGNYKPMAFGSLGRQLPERAKWAGTYDQKWLDETFPFLPKDFDERYFQAAPSDQQTDSLNSGEEVELINLTPRGRTVFRLPTTEMPVMYFPWSGPRQEQPSILDTLIIEPDLGRFQLVWRTSRPLRRNMLEIGQVAVGLLSRGWYRAFDESKRYFPSLREYIAARNTEPNLEPEEIDEESESEEAVPS